MIDAGKHPTGMWPQRLVRPYVEPYGIPPYIVWYRKVKGKRELFNTLLHIAIKHLNTKYEGSNMCEIK